MYGLPQPPGLPILIELFYTSREVCLLLSYVGLTLSPPKMKSLCCIFSDETESLFELCRFKLLFCIVVGEMELLVELCGATLIPHPSQFTHHGGSTCLVVAQGVSTQEEKKLFDSKFTLLFCHDVEKGAGDFFRMFEILKLVCTLL